MSGTCQPSLALCASANSEEENDHVASKDKYFGSENSCTSSNNESTDSYESYPPSLSDDQDFDDNAYGYKAQYDHLNRKGVLTNSLA